MPIALGADHAGRALCSAIAAALTEAGHTPVDLNEPRLEAERSGHSDYPEAAARVAQFVATVPHARGILICGTGLGMALAANAIPSIRAACCTHELMARLARAHNDCNVLCLGARIVGPALAQSMVDIFLSTAFDGGRHAARLDQVARLAERR
jgi:ribose 5-phosphate isomerase B